MFLIICKLAISQLSDDIGFDITRPEKEGVDLQKSHALFNNLSVFLGEQNQCSVQSSWKSETIERRMELLTCGFPSLQMFFVQITIYPRFSDLLMQCAQFFGIRFKKVVQRFSTIFFNSLAISSGSAVGSNLTGSPILTCTTWGGT